MSKKINIKFNMDMESISNPFLYKYDIFGGIYDTIKVDIIYDIKYKIFSGIGFEQLFNIDEKSCNLIMCTYNPKFQEHKLNLEEEKKIKENITKYIDDQIYLQQMRKYFFNEYSDPTNLKNAHLSDKCSVRNGKTKTTTKCDIEEFLNYNKYHKNDIIQYTLNILEKNNIKICRKINKNEACACFLINKIDQLLNFFEEYIKYSVALLNQKKYIIRYPKYLPYNDVKNFIFINDDDDKLCIKHYNIIHKIKKNDELYKTEYIVFSKTPKRNDIFFY